jgi:hypothetical protein
VWTEIRVIDDVLLAHAPELGADLPAYRNHAYRVANLCAALRPPDEHSQDSQDKIAIAAVMHDLGIWTAHTFDYLPPSIELATDYLGSSGRSEWVPEVTTMIREHHKVTAYRGNAHKLVEAFRRADLVDVSRGAVGYGLPRNLIREIFSTWPNAGFHKRLAQLAFERLRLHPLSPLPMPRW